MKITLVLAPIILAGSLAGGFFLFSSSEAERATKLYSSAQTYATNGDPARAMIELRKAIQIQPEQSDARVMLAGLLLSEGRAAEAFEQYEAVFQGDPQNAVVARAMARIAFEEMAWSDARKYSQVVLSEDPADSEARAISAGVSYHEAIRDGDVVRREQAFEEAARILHDNAEILSARRIIISEYLRLEDYETASKYAIDGIALYPNDRYLNNTYLHLLSLTQDIEGVERQLTSMITRYPEDDELVRDLVRLYVSSGRIDEAEQRLRDKISPDGSDPGPRLVLLRFLSEIRSPEAMHAELVKILAEDPLPADVAKDAFWFRALKAQAEYSLGRQDYAISQMADLIDGNPDADRIDDGRVMLARMRLDTGDTAGAEALVEEVLVHDSRQIEAIKIKGRLLIDRAEAESAVTLLRDALTNTPADPQITTLLARAYELAGEPNLMAELFAGAAETSAYAPRDSLRYAILQVERGNYADAERVLSEALRRQPNDLDLRAMLVRVHIAMRDWSHARDDIGVISERFDTEISRSIVQTLTAQMLSDQGRGDELTELLSNNVGSSSDPLNARIAVIQNTLATEGADQAIAEAEALAADNPTAAALRGLIVQLRVAHDDDVEVALSDAKSFVEDYPEERHAWLLLQEAQTRNGRPDEALATIDAALVRFPRDRALRISKANVQERRGDTGAAIAIYEEMYAENSTDTAVANNLASLLSATGSDPESLDRAWTLAKRLNGSQDPSFQDTFGWIALRRGDVATALPLLEQAAAGLPNDASVAYHLGRAYAALGRNDRARSEYDRVDQLLEQGAFVSPSIMTDIAAARAELQ